MSGAWDVWHVAGLVAGCIGIAIACIAVVYKYGGHCGECRCCCYCDENDRQQSDDDNNNNNSSVSTTTATEEELSLDM